MESEGEWWGEGGLFYWLWGMDAWAGRRILREARYRVSGCNAQKLKESVKLLQAYVSNVPCKIDFTSERSEPTVDHWVFERLGFPEDESRVVLYSC